MLKLPVVATSLACLLTAAIFGGTASGAAQELGASEPALVLLISVDQMRADYIDRFSGRFTGGFRRLLDEGAVFANARQDHAITATAPGHAAMLSGRYPSSHGIVDNSWYDHELQRRERASHDPADRIIGLAVPEDGPGGSPRQFKGSSLVGWLHDRNPNSHSVSISRKDRSAVLMAPEAEQAYWFHWSGRFITSTYYGTELPDWVTEFNDRDWLAGHVGGEWNLLKRRSDYDLSRADTYEGERGARGFGNVFPHPLSEDRQVLGNQILATPFMDEAVLDLGRAAIAGADLGTDGVTDVLALGLSATDSIGHAFGPFSREIEDQMLRLDLLLGEFLDFVDETVGLDRVLVVLTADHGVVALPEYSLELGYDAGRVPMRQVTDGLDLHLTAEFGGERWFRSFSYGWLQVDRAQATSLGIDADDIVARAKEYVDTLSFVEATFTRQQLLVDEEPQSDLEERVRRSFYAARSGDLYVVHKPLYLWQTGSAANHQSPHDYDRHVPLIFRGPGFVPGIYAEPAAVVDIAPTLASILGVEIPGDVEGTVRTEAIRPSAEATGRR